MRALSDPVIVYEPAAEWAPEEGHRIYNDITQARLAQNLENPIDERIQYATWPEAVVYFSTVTMDEQYATKEVKELYQYSFRRFVDRWLDSESLPVSVELYKDVDISTVQEDRLNDLRFGLKKDRDTYFVENMYDEFSPENVPKTFWLTKYERDREQESLDDMSQSALQDYMKND